MWETIIQGLLQSPKCQAGERIIDSLEAGNWVLYRQSFIDSINTEIIAAHQSSLDETRAIAFTVIIVSMVLIVLIAGGTAFFFEHTERGMRYISKRYQKYLEKKGVALET